MSSTPVPVAPTAYPVVVAGRLDSGLSRWLWLVKWVLVIPHLLVLAFLWVGFLVLTVFAMVAIVVTGRYPRPLFDYNVGVLRWTWRVAYYAYGALGTDQYPPFSLADRDDYPARLQVDYPEHLSRGLALVKWWLLAIPHYLLVGIFVGGGAWVVGADDNGGGISLVGLLVVVAAVALLVTGTYPRTVFDLVLGLNRWILRVAAYAGLMTDRYPPFRLDQGGDDPGSLQFTEDQLPLDQPSGGEPSDERRGRGPGRWTGGRTVAVTLGAVGTLVGLALAVGGVGLLVFDQAARDDAGFVTTGTSVFTTPTAALASDLELSVAGPDWLSASEQLGAVSVTARARSGGAVFVGIGPRDQVTAWLGSTAYDKPSDVRDETDLTREGTVVAPLDDPAGQSFWVRSRTGTGPQRLVWDTRGGDWMVVVTNADGSTGVQVAAKVGATLPHLDSWGVAVLAAGVIVLGLGALAIGLGVPRSR
jgi:hypothetical protein